MALGGQFCGLSSVAVAAPTPNPAGFAVAPHANGGTAISMTATLGSDTNGPVEYLFSETSGHAGGDDSGWQTSPSYVDSGLTTGETYTYTVTMRDAEGSEGVASAPVTVVANDKDFFSVNFYTYGGLYPADYDAVTLEADESAGVGEWRTFGWVNVEVPWEPDVAAPPVPLTSLFGTTATFTLNDARRGGPYFHNIPHRNFPGDGNGDLMDARAYGTYDPGDGSHNVSITVADIPYASYDVMIYLGAKQNLYGDGKGKLVFNGSEQDFTLAPGEFAGFVEITNAVTPGNYVVFEGVTGESFSVQAWGEGANGFNHIGPAGFQIRSASPIADTTAPTPNPATFALLPNPESNGTITMAATTGSDFSGPVAYLFTETSGNAGGTSSSWQGSPNYTDSGLTSNLVYSYTVTMRDAHGNSGDASAPAMAAAGFFTNLTVNYSTNESTAGSAPVDGTDYSTGDSVTVLGNPGVLTRTGYVFAGWNTAADWSGTTFAAGDTFSIVGNTTLYARWLEAYTVTFQPGDHGALAGGTPNVSHAIGGGEPCPTPPAVIPEPGYEFVTWSAELPAVITGPLTVSAQYRLPTGDLKVLVIGSTRSYNAGEKAFNPTAIAAHLDSMLSQDLAGTNSVHVEFEDVYTSKVVRTAYNQAVSWYDVNYHRYSLAQYLFWPDGKAERLANLRGEGDHEWDYIIISGDPYLMAAMPGVYAEGVRAIQEEVAKGSAELVLLGQWPENSSDSSTTEFNEKVYRVGNSAGVEVVPAGLAWDGLTDVSGLNLQDTDYSHPTPNGAYLAAAAIYSQMFDRSASSSGYRYAVSGDAIADHALSVVQATDPTSQYTGDYTSETPHHMIHARHRAILARHNGTSSENGMSSGITAAKAASRLDASGVDYFEFHHGRWWGTKSYQVGSGVDASFGYALNHNGQTAAVTCLYDIDGDDLGLAQYMILRGEVPSAVYDVRPVPWRLLWSKMHHLQPTFPIQSDGWHASGEMNIAAGSYIVSLISGRCAVPEEPANKLSPAWRSWFCHKLGYETAWQMSHLTLRAPGFKVLPSEANALTVTPTTTETMTVRFINPPQSDVTVTVTSSNPGAALVYPKTLTFTPENYKIPQAVTVAGAPGADASEPFSVDYATASADEVYDGLSDSWAYTTTRSSVQSVTVVDHGVMPIGATQTVAEVLDLQAAGAAAGNTTILGPQYGSLEWTGPGTIAYTAALGYTGKDEITYVATVGDTQTIGFFDITVTTPDGQVNVVASDAVAAEEGTETGSWTIERAGATTAPLAVLFTLDGAATVGDDYTLSATNTVTIPVGASSLTITLTPADDAVSAEGSETAVMTVSADAAYSIGAASSATITIADNDTSAPLVEAGSDQTVAFHEGTPWSPDVMGMDIWLDASDAATVEVGEGNSVSEWRDKSGHERHMEQPTEGARPTYNPTGWNDSLPCLEVVPWNATGSQRQSLRRYVDDDGIGGDAYTLFVVADVADTNSSKYIHFQRTASSFVDRYMVSGTGGEVSGWQRQHLENSYGGARASTAGAPGRQLLQYSLATTNSAIHRDGVQIAGNEGNHRAGVLTDLFTVNGGDHAGGGGIIGSFAEFIFMTENPTPADRQRMEGYLAHKWDLIDGLSMDHPYKEHAPMASTVSLDGSASDVDGDLLTLSWRMISGPGPVRFTDAAAADTTATFVVPGDYLLRLSASDGTDTVSSDVTITIHHVDILVSESDGATVVDEDGAEDAFTVVLNTAPSAEVTVSVTPDSQVDVSLSALTFTTNNWDEPQSVTVSPVDDTIYEPVQEGTISLVATSSDAFWDGLGHTLIATVIDNDTNSVPLVDAGLDRSVVLQEGASGPEATIPLNGTVTDNEQTPVTTWSVVSGPAGVTFDDASAVDTAVHFATTPGIYVLRLSADDGFLQASDEVTMNVVLASEWGVVSRPASDLGSTFATLNADLLAPATNVDVYVYWGQTNQGTNFGWSASDHLGSWADFTWTNLSYALTSLTPDTTYFYTFCASNSAGVYWAPTNEQFTTLAAPTPNPAGFEVLPMPVNDTMIRMVATTASASVGPVEYRFHCTSGGGHDSEWQTSTSYIDSGLTPGTTYSYDVTTRDGLGNAGNPSAAAAATTDVGPDGVAPLVALLNPLNGASNVAFDAVLQVTFSEPIRSGSGTILLKNLTEASEESINVTNGTQVAIEDTSLTITPASPLERGDRYAVQIAAGAIEDLAGNDYVGIDTDTDWAFTAINPLPEVTFLEASGSGAESNTAVMVAITLSHPYAGTVSVQPRLATPGGTAALGDDFTYAAAPVTFDEGETNKSFELTIIDDLAGEDSETIAFELGPIVNGTKGAADRFVYTILPDHSDWGAIPFSEPFEASTLGALDGQRGWSADGVEVQTNVTHGGSGQAAAITSEQGSLEHQFNNAMQHVWTDMRMRVVQMQELPEIPTNIATAFFVATNSHVMVCDGTNVVSSGLTAAEGEWARFTVESDYATATWWLYVDEVKAGPFGFVDATITGYEKLVISGGSGRGVLDDILVSESTPLVVYAAGGTITPQSWVIARGGDPALPNEDGDDLSLDQEYLINTDPTEANRFEIIEVGITPGTQPYLKYRAYGLPNGALSVSSCTNLVVGNWRVLAGFLSTPSSNVVQWTGHDIVKQNEMLRIDVTE